MITELCNIMAEEGSDKSDLKEKHHNYTIEYYNLFDSVKERVLNVFELGLGTNNTDIKSSMGVNGIPGASLRGWKRYFKNANIYGADIDSRILFTEERIKTFFVDQTNVDTINNLWQNEDIKNVQFDIIIDDGLHEFEANMIFFEHSFFKLRTKGLYIIEDVIHNTLNSYISYLNSLKEKYSFIYETKILPHENNNYDNCLIIIKKI